MTGMLLPRTYPTSARSAMYAEPDDASSNSSGSRPSGWIRFELRQ